jgi:ribosomal protein S18 acetylase RimI-like enzyme
MTFSIRNYAEPDRDSVNRIAVEAFSQYKNEYSSWPELLRRIDSMASLSHYGEIIVAEGEKEILGAVAYIPPGANQGKADFFDPSWAIMRMLVVSPHARGRGVGRRLAEESIRRGIEDGAGIFALHTSPIMQVALSMYLRMGFQFYKAAPDFLGVPYGIYVKSLQEHQS